MYWKRWDFCFNFDPPSLQYPACEAQQFDFLAVPWLCWKFISKNEKLKKWKVMKSRGCLGKYTLDQNTKILTFTRIPIRLQLP